MELDESVPKLTKEEYWEWRTTIAEMNTAKEKLLATVFHHQVLKKEAELLSVKAQLHKSMVVDSAQKDYDEFRSEYDRFKASLEKRLGISLNEKLIDDITLEVRDLPNDNKKENS